MNKFESASLWCVRKLDTTDVDHALHHMEIMRCPLRMVDEGLADDIHDLMEEFGDENDLSEGWWLEYGDEEDVLFTGLKMKYDEEQNINYDNRWTATEDV